MSVIRNIQWGNHKPQLGVRHNPGSNPLSYGLVGHWILNESGGLTAYDLSGRVNHGTLSGDPTRTTGKFGGALSFDGSNDFISAGKGASIADFAATTGGGPASWAFWIKPVSNTAGTVMSRSDGNVSGAYWWIFFLDNPPAAMQLELGRTTASAIREIVAPAIGVWSHVVWTKSSNAVDPVFTAYINGIPVTITDISTGSGTSASDAAAPFYIGKYDDGNTAASAFVSAVLDDVRVYNKVLSANEAMSLYLNPFADMQSIRRVIGHAIVATGGRIFKLAGRGGGLAGPNIGLAG